jgi:hypothetical protein
MILIAFVPLLYPPVPPLVDLMGHMARYRVELDLANSPDLHRYFDFHWKPVGNLGVDLLVVPLSKVFGLELAVKLIAIVIPPMTVAGFLWVAREVHHRLPPTVAFALPFTYAHPFLFGFLNFTLAMALAFLAFGLWLRLGRLERTRLRLALFVPISFLLYFSHIFGLGTLGLLAFSAEAVRQHDKGIGWWKAGLHAALHASALALPLVLMLLWRTGAPPNTTGDFFNFWAKAAFLLQSLRDTVKWFDFASVAVILVVIVEARRQRKLTFSRNLAFSALVLLAGFVLLPRIIFGSAYADMRLAPFMLAVAVLAIRFRDETYMPLARVLAVLGVAFFLVRIGYNTYNLARAADDHRAKLAALDYIPRGAPMITIVGEDCRKMWPMPRNSHLGAMATVRRHAFSNDQWAMDVSSLLTVRFTEAGHFRNDPSQITRGRRCSTSERWLIDHALQAIPGGVFDYVWLVDPLPFDQRLVADFIPVWRGPRSILYATGPEAADAARREKAQ